MPRDVNGSGFTVADTPPLWGEPDMGVLRNHRRAPPPLPLEVFGAEWRQWIEGAAEAAACPPDYVALPLLAAASALIGNARWAQAGPGWCEPPHLWTCVVGDSGSSKSPGADCLLRDVLPDIEHRMQGDFPDRLREWQATAEARKAALAQWQADVKTAQKLGNAPPLPPAETVPPEPVQPRLRQNDVTIERVATLLAAAAPKGLLIVRDEFAGWLLGMNSYHDAGRAFWIEAYGGRPYRVERQKHPEPITVPRLAVAVTGGTQPEKLNELFREADDGLFSRIVWAWPDPVPFRLGRNRPAADIAIAALDRLRALQMLRDETGETRPIMLPVAADGLTMLEEFARTMQQRQGEAGALLCSAYGKARGLALRLSLVLALLRWCSGPPDVPEPAEIDAAALAAACDLVDEYFMPMAERVFGDAACPVADRNAATLARWIVRERPEAVHVRELQRKVRLPGLGTADAIKEAAAVLVEAGWLGEPPVSTQQGRAAVAYPVNPLVRGASHG